MIPQIDHDHLTCDIPSAPASIADTSKVSAPRAFLQLWKPLLKFSRAWALEFLSQLTHTQTWPILEALENVILRYSGHEYLHILSITELDQQGTATQTDIVFQSVEALFRASDYAHRWP